jgi:hypothetical protein
MDINAEPKVKVRRPDTKLEKIIKLFLYFLIFAIIGVTVYAHTLKDAMGEESESVISQINRAQDLYAQMAGKYHYFQKTKYDDTLGVDVSANRFYTAYAVIPSGEQYEVKLYGRTNPFSIGFHDLKTAIFAKK